MRMMHEQGVEDRRRVKDGAFRGRHGKYKSQGLGVRNKHCWLVWIESSWRLAVASSRMIARPCVAARCKPRILFLKGTNWALVLMERTRARLPKLW